MTCRMAGRTAGAAMTDDAARAPGAAVPSATRSEATRATVPVAVLVSGSGSNLMALADAIADGRVPARIVGVVSDVPDALALTRAADRGLPVMTVAFDRSDRPGWERRLADTVSATGAQLVVLAGFMRVLTATFLSRWPDRVVNVHPSLLPAFRGAHAVDDALAAGVSTTGVSVHLVDELVDHGPLLAQESVDILPDDTRDTLLGRLHAVEHRLLPTCVATLCDALLHADPASAAPSDPDRSSDLDPDADPERP
jgi:phosphoribosylglycinamide formyltransferase 1